MIEIRRFSIVLFLFLVLVSCRSELNDPIIVANLEQEFGFSLEQVLGSDHTVRFKLSTLDLADCLNYSIQAELNRRDPELEIDILEIQAPKDCEAGLAPARGAVQADELTLDEYLLRLSLKDVANTQGELRIFPDHYLLSLEQNSSVIPLHEEVRRVPANSCWGFVSWNDPTGFAIAQAFLAEFQSTFQPLTAPNGYYSYFEITSGNVEVFNPSPPADAEQSRYFLVDMKPGALAELNAIVQQYRQNATTTHFNIEILTSTGERI
jgi:hypothetical protein